MNSRSVQLLPGLAPHDVELIDIEMWRVNSPMGSPLSTAAGTFDHREGLIIRLQANVAGFDVKGYGEASPLPGWGTDRLSLARFELTRLRDGIFAGACPDPVAALAQLTSGSARFAFSTALLDAVAHARRRPLRHLFDAGAGHAVRVNATIGCTTIDDAVDRARRAIEAGFGTLKLKVGDDDDVARVSAVRGAAPEVAIRLDANGSWTLAEARAKLDAFAEFGIEYVEQPVARAELATLRTDSPIKIAADESCLPLESVDELVAAGAVDVLVMKPSILGTWFEIIDVVERARLAGIEVVFTTALDFAVARAAVAQMAAALLGPEVVCGLATGRHPLDVVSAEEPVVGGRLLLGSGNGLGISVDSLPGDP